MKNITKKITAIFAVCTMAIGALSVGASAGQYHFTGNQLVADGKISASEGMAKNFAQAISESPLNQTNADLWGYVNADGDTFQISQTAMNDVIDYSIGRVAEATGTTEIYYVYKAAEICIYAWHDFGVALNDLSAARRDQYKAAVSAYYNTSVNSVLRLLTAVNKQVNAGNSITDEALTQAQKLINSFQESANILRKYAKKDLKKYKNELNSMASALDKLIKTDIKGYYKKAVAVAESKKYCPGFERCTTSSNAFCISIVLREKGYNYSQHDVVYYVGKYPGWGYAESTFGLYDGGNYTDLYGLNSNNIINRISGIYASGRTSCIIRLNPIAEDNYKSYIIAKVENGTVKFLDPFGNGKWQTAAEYASANGYSEAKLWGRMACVWSYV